MFFLFRNNYEKIKTIHYITTILLLIFQIIIINAFFKEVGYVSA